MSGSKSQQELKKMRHKRGVLRMKHIGPSVMSALQVWLWLLIFIFQNEFKVTLAAEPGYLDFDNLPETNFSCTGKVIGGYYADLETDCQMFHVCTIGQLEEPMDIKFLCLNGTVFDQETRVCERVDEVDCSKSVQFYSLNLELYGNTAPPIIKEVPKTNEDVDNEEEEEYDEEIYDEIATTTKATTTTSTSTTTTTTTTTKRPTTPSRFFPTTPKPFYHSTPASYLPQKEDSIEEDEEEEPFDIIKSNVTKPNYQNSFANNQQTHIKNQYESNKNIYNDYHEQDDPQNSNIDDDGVEIGDGDDADEDPHLFSPQDFIYHHNKQANNPNFNKNSAISFQHHTYTNDGQNSHVTVTTHTGRLPNFNNDKDKLNNKPDNPPPQQTRTYLSNPTPRPEIKTYNEKSPYNSFQTYNNQKKPSIPTNPPNLTPIKHQNEPLFISFRKPTLIPHGFQPSPASTKTVDNQPKIKTQAKPVQSYQPSERHEIALNTQYDFEKLTPSYPFIQDFQQFHYEQKRSQNSDRFDHESASIKTTQPTTVTPTPYFNTWATRSNNYTKSLPRVIVTASASVSDSNGKKLNYTVGNIVHAVKPLVPTNYDDYKESDALLDPFFLDVPKLKKSRSRRSHRKIRSKRQTIITKHPTRLTTTTTKQTTDLENPLSSIISTTQSPFNRKTEHTTAPSFSTSTPTTVNFDIPSEFMDYVNDNYEPLVYKEPERTIQKNPFKPSKAFNYQSTSNKKILDGNTYLKFKNSVELSTLQYLSKTTLDIANIETTTMGFLNAKENLGVLVKKVELMKTSDVSDNNKKYPCNKFYVEKNCRTFHLCVNEFNNGQMLHVQFECEPGKYFDESKPTHCSNIKPNSCK